MYEPWRGRLIRERRQRSGRKRLRGVGVARAGRSLGTNSQDGRRPQSHARPPVGGERETDASASIRQLGLGQQDVPWADVAVRDCAGHRDRGSSHAGVGAGAQLGPPPALRPGWAREPRSGSQRANASQSRTVTMPAIRSGTVWFRADHSAGKYSGTSPANPRPHELQGRRRYRLATSNIARF